MINEIEKKYDVLLRLGSGGFAQVFKVKEKESGKLFALKIIGFGEDDTPIDLDSQEYKDIIQEVEILKKFNSQNIVKVYEHFVLDGKFCILMEFVEGQTLEEILKKEIVLETEHVLDITLQISVALMHCHDLQFNPSEIGYKTETAIIKEKAIIHNDIHPKNIIRRVLPGEEFQYVLIDFGLSFQNANTALLIHTKNGLAEYKSPEKWLGKPLLPSSDIYSLGILLFRCIGGSVPFRMTGLRNEDELKKEHLLGPIPDLWDLRKTALVNHKDKTISNPDYPYWLQVLVEKSLNKNPEERFYSGKVLNAYYHDGKKGKLAIEWPQVNEVKKIENIKTEEIAGKEDPEPRIFEELLNYVKENSKIIRNWSLLLAGIILLTWLGVSFWQKNDEPVYLVEKYLQIDASVEKKEDVQKLLPYLSFPLQYYDKRIQDSNSFVNLYGSLLNKYEKRELNIISINPSVYSKSSVIVSGKLNLYFYNSKNTYRVNPISFKDSIVIKDGKIEGFIRMKKK